jgi:hypothetical protein
MSGQELTTIASVIIATLAVSRAIDLWIQTKILRTPTSDPSPCGEDIPSVPKHPYRRDPIMSAAKLEVVHHGDLRVAILDYEVSLAEYQQADAAATDARETAERLERLRTGLYSNLADCENTVKHHLKEKGDITVVASSGKVYSRELFESDDFLCPPDAVLLH